MFFLSALGYFTSTEFEAMTAISLPEPFLMPAKICQGNQPHFKNSSNR